MTRLLCRQLLQQMVKCPKMFSSGKLNRLLAYVPCVSREASCRPSEDSQLESPSRIDKSRRTRSWRVEKHEAVVHEFRVSVFHIV